MEDEPYASKSRSIDHYFATGNEMLLKVVPRLEELQKDKTEKKWNEKKIDKFRVCNYMVNLETIQTIKNQKTHGTGSGMEISREKQKACYQQPQIKY